jgi:hypothetical protein
MTITEADYFAARTKLLSQYQSVIIGIEYKYTQFLTEVILATVANIYTDFCLAKDLRPFWVNYPPLQRGRAPSGTSIPWGEVGEKTISARLINEIASKKPSISYPGLPLGGDIRFATEDAYIHFDLKLTGPNDNAHEIVASPHQIAGDGRYWEDGVVNSLIIVRGKRAKMEFQPELPPFYILDTRILLCLTYFLKVVYTVQDLGDQPLHYLELVCVPNGLLLFDGPNYAQRKGLLIPGKDEQGHSKKRTRVRLAPLAHIDSWRCTQFVLGDAGWQLAPRDIPGQTIQLSLIEE